MAHRILVVDDDRMSRLVTQSLLEKLGYEVDVLNDGRGVVEAEATGAFDVIIMDCQMPHVDGFQATAAVRREQAGRRRPRTPIIGLSARSMEGDDELAIAKGMDAYITKPVTAHKLRAAFEQVLPATQDRGRAQH